MAVAAVAGIVRWTVADFTSSPVILAFVQPLHGFTFALLHLAAGAGDRASGADPFGCNGTSHIRHAVHRAGYGPSDPRFRPAL